MAHTSSAPAWSGAPVPAPDDARGSVRALRTEHRKERRRRLVLDAAEELFAAQGYDKTSIEAIAVASGYSVGAIYTFFPGKRALYDAVIDQHTQALVARLAACEDIEATGLDQLLDMVSAAIATMRGFPDHARLIHAGLPATATTGDDVPSGRRDNRVRQVLECYTAAIMRGQRDGTVRDGGARHLAQYVGGLVYGHMQVDPELSGHTDGLTLAPFLDIVRAALQRA